MKNSVSVYMTVKNGEKHLHEAVASVTRQTLKEWELVIVDDGSSDGTVGILERAASADHRIKIFTTPGIGRGRALNPALKKCSAPYVANLDADDLCHPRRLEMQLKAIAENPAYGLLSSSKYRMWENSVIRWGLEECSYGQIKDANKLLAFGNPICHSAIMAQRESLLSVGGYNEARVSQLDYDLWVRLAQSEVKLGLICIPLVAKRVHSGQSFERRHRVKYLLAALKLRVVAIKSFRGGPTAWFMLAVWFSWGLLPVKARFILTDLLRRSA